MARCAVRAGSRRNGRTGHSATTFVPSPDAALGDGDSAAHCPYLPTRQAPDTVSIRQKVSTEHSQTATYKLRLCWSVLKFEIWNFSGVWRLMFGAFF